ncbi:hypothetical protein F4775DRAFT_538442 [Biscogniauxia sp. FL1348]|nr:hypothetical protein F4775DRAFT_538442 [Biscogniauxia sp. FL1348]
MPLLVPQTNANDAPAPAAPDNQGQSGGGSGEAARPTGAGVDTGAGTTREKTAAEIEADRLYEERMEEEYAKREGGA